MWRRNLPRFESAHLGVLNHERSLEFDVTFVHAKAGAVEAHAPEYLQRHVKESHVVDGSRQLRTIGVGAREEKCGSESVGCLTP